MSETTAPGPFAAATRQSVALLGGSFNPPHVAHLMVAYWALSTQRVSQVWLLPTYRHPFGKGLAPFADRVEMCRLAAKALRGGHVCEAEAELADDPLVGKTVRTLEHLTEKHPNTCFSLVVGSDVLNESSKWYRWDRVTQLARIIVAARAGHASGKSGGLMFPQISSSDIRDRIARDEDVSDLLPRAVLEYIQEHDLYR